MAGFVDVYRKIRGWWSATALPVPGVLRIVAAQAYVHGMDEAEVYRHGMTAREVYVHGMAEAEVYQPGASAGEVYVHGATATQVEPV